MGFFSRTGSDKVAMTDRDALARLIIHMAAVVVWALSGKDKEFFCKVRELGEVKWEEIKGG